MAVTISVLFPLITIGLLCYWLWKRFTYNHDFFKKQGLKYKTPIPLFGNSNFLKLFYGVKFIDLIQADYQRFPDEKISGQYDFFTPKFFIRSPEIIKQLTVKDFAHFQDHKLFMDPDSSDIFNNILFFMKGKRWRDMRSSLSPLFTGSKMRNMLELINKCSQQMVNFITEGYVKNGPIAYSTKDIFSRYTTDVIATCAFGVECNSLKSPENEIYLLGQKILSFQKPSKILEFFFIKAFPKLANLLDITIIDSETKNRFHDLIIYAMDERKREGILRPDMIQLLMKLKDGHVPTSDIENEMIKGSEIKPTWSDDELIAQCFLFFLAGFDTSSTVMNFTAYELAINPDIQNHLIDEIDRTAQELNGNPLTYEALQKMKYLDTVFSEVLRKWPPLIAIDRECVKDYSYEDENGLKFKVEKGNMIWIPVYAFHMDPKYFPNPEKFDPKRFSDENKHNINFDIYLPFGVGPRSCIGMRFALMELKSLFYYLLLNFTIKPSQATQIPMKLKKAAFNLIPEKEILLYIEPRNSKSVHL